MAKLSIRREPDSLEIILEISLGQVTMILCLLRVFLGL